MTKLPVPAVASICAILAFIAGFADACTFVGADGIFCSALTGTIVVVAANLARGVYAEEWLKLAIFPTFIIAVLVVEKLHRTWLARGRFISRMLLRTNVVMFGAVAAIGWLTDPSPRSTARCVVVLVMTAAMAVQSAFHRFDPRLSRTTTVMTTNLTTFLANRRAASLASDAAEAKSLKEQQRGLAGIIVAFVIGCLSGALGVSRFGFTVVIVPMALSLWASMKLP